MSDHYELPSVNCGYLKLSGIINAVSESHIIRDNTRTMKLWTVYPWITECARGQVGSYERIIPPTHILNALYYPHIS